MKIAFLHTPEGRPDIDPSRDSGFQEQNGLFTTGITSAFRDVLPLSNSYEETLACFGQHTRRNIRIARKTAASLRILFSMFRGECHLPHQILYELAARTRPLLHTSGRIAKFEKYVDHTGEGFRSYLRTPGGHLVSYCCGYLHEGTAYLIYQLNDAAWNSLSPSLLHRAYLIETLITMGARDLIFVHGCSGVLQHACHPMSVDQTWVMRSNLSARILTKAVATMAPIGVYRHLASQAIRQSATI